MQDFSSKYLKSNFVVKGLIRSFYASAKSMVSGIDANNVLEVGCGPGFSTQYLREFLGSRHLEASEYEAELVAEARKRNPGIAVRQESIYGLRRSDHSFDLVIAFEVLEHLENPEAALRELQRVTSKYCLISVPQEPLWRILNACRFKHLKNLGNSPGHVQHWSKKQFTHLVGKYFEIIAVKKPLPWLMILGQKK